VTDNAISRDIFERLRQSTAGNPAEFTELCRDYLVDARSAISGMRTAIADGDAHELRARSHYLRGSSMMLGAKQLSQCCATLEHMARNSELGSAEPMLQEVVAALEAVEAELIRELGPVVAPAEGSAA